MNRVSRVESQSVDVIDAEPMQRVFDEIIPHAIAPFAVEIDRGAPWRSIFVSEIRPEAREIIPFRPEMVVNDVKDHRQPGLVAGVDEPLQSRRPAVYAMRREWINAVVAPVSLARKFGDRH